MNKKKILLIASLSLSAVVISTFTAVSLPNIISANYDDSSYSLTMDKDHHIFNYSEEYDSDLEMEVGKGFVKTDKDAPISVRMSKGESYYTSNDYFVDYGDKTGFIEVTAPIHGLTKMEYEANCSLIIKAGYSLGKYVGQQEITISEMTSGVLDFDSLVSDYHIPPNYLRIELNSESESHIINKIKLHYTCMESGDPTEPVGNFTTEFNDDGYETLTITGFNMDGYSIPANKTLIIPNKIGKRDVTRVAYGVFDNVPWVEHLYIPFCGGTKYLNSPSLGFNFANIFGHNSIHVQYQAIQQYSSGSGYNIFYIPKALKHITVTGCTYNMPNHEDIKCIPAYAFYGCNKMITKIDFTCDFVTVKEGAFGNCSAIKELILPESCATAEKGAFAGCSNLYIRSRNFSFKLDEKSNPDYRGYSFGYVKSIVQDGVHYDIISNTDGWKGAVITGGDKDLVSFTIYDTIQVEGFGNVKVDTVANRAFEGHDKLRYVYFRYIGGEMMGYFSFKDCYLTTFMLWAPYDQNWPTNWKSGAGRVYYNYDNQETPKTLDGYHYIPMDKEFLKGDPLHKGCLFDKVDESVGTDLDFASILAKVKEADLDYEDYYTGYFATCAFENDQNITSIKLPNKLVLPNYSFMNCSNLTDVYYDGTEEEWNDHIHDGDIGYNIFFNTQVSVIHVSDGNGGYTDIPLIK